MKKFLALLVVVLCVLCGALPALADTVSTSADLIAAVDGAAEGVKTVITVNGTIDMGTTSLTIAKSRDIELVLNEGCNLNFAGSTMWLKAITNNGTLTISGKGNLSVSNTYSHTASYAYVVDNCGSVTITGGNLTAVMSADKCGDSCIINQSGSGYKAIVKDGNLTAKTITAEGNSSAYAKIISNNGSNQEVTVSGGVLSADINIGKSSAFVINNNGGYSAKSGHKVLISGGTFSATNGDGASDACVVNNNGHGHTVVITGGKFSVKHGTGIGYANIVGNNGGSLALHNVVITGGTFSAQCGNDEKKNYVVKGYASAVSAMLLGGDFTGKPYYSYSTASWNLTESIYSGTFKSYGTWNDSWLASGCTSSVSGDVLTVTNAATLAFDKDTCKLTSGQSDSVKVTFTVGGEPAEIAKLELLDASTLPEGLTVEASSSDKTITVANTNCALGTYKVTAMASDDKGSFVAVKTLTITIADPEPEPEPEPEPYTTPEPAPKPVTPVVSEDQLPQDVKPAEQTYTSTNVEQVAEVISENFEKTELTQDANNNVTVEPAVAAEAISTLGSEVKAKDVVCLPIISTPADDTKIGKVIMVTFKVAGETLSDAKTPSEIRLYKILGSDRAEQFEYVDSLDKTADKKFTVQTEDGAIATSIEESKNYLVSTYVLDGGDFDLDNEANGGIIDPVAINTSTEETPTPSSGGGSNGGCNAGFGALGLAALAALAATRRKK